MKCKLFVFRHAQTFDNKYPKFSGWRDSRLTLYGEEEAHLTKMHLKKEIIDYAFQSHQRRSKDTLKIVLEGHKKIPIFTDDRIIERCYGTLQGKSKLKFKKNDAKHYQQLHRGYSVPPPKGESLKMINGRINSFIHDLIKFLRKNPGNAAISCHGNSMRMMRKHLEKLNVKQTRAVENPQDKPIIYSIDIPMPKCCVETKWQSIRLNKQVRLATDKRNNLKKFY